MPCQRQVAAISLPIPGSAVALTYASDRAPGRTADRSPAADAIGLAGWTLSILDTVDLDTHTEITGTGLRRQITGIPVPGGGIAVADPTGARISVFDGSGREISLVDGVTGAKLLTFAWEDSGLAGVSDPAGQVLTVTRAAGGAPTAISVRGGGSLSLGIRDGQLAGVGYPDGGVAIIHTAAGGLVDQIWDPAGATEQYRYDDQGRLLSTTTGAGASTGYSRSNTDGHLTVTTTLPTGAQLIDTVARDGDTVTRTHTDASGGTTTQVENGDDRTITAPSGGTVQLSYAPDPRWGADAPVLKTGQGDSSDVAQTATAATGSGPEAAVALDRAITLAGATWTFHYDPDTRTSTVTDPAGITSATVTDADGRILTRSGGGRVAVGYGYDGQGRLASVTLGTGPDARTWRYEYRPHTIAITDPAGGVQVRTLDAAGRLTSVTGPGSQSLTLGRDGSGEIISFAAATGGTYQLTRRADGSLAAVNAPAGQDDPQFTGFSYDAAGQLIGETTATTALTVARNAAGYPIAVDTGSGSYTAAYDGMGRLTTWTGPDISTVDSYTGRYVTAEEMTGAIRGRITRTVDGMGRTVSETVDGTDPVQYRYDAAGRLVSAGALSITLDKATGRVAEQRIGAVTETFTRNQFGETMRELVTGPSGPIADIAYQRDGLGRVTAVRSIVAGATSATAYSYDPAGRLASETTDGKRTAYSYDAAGNLTSITDPGGDRTTFDYDGRNAVIRSGGTRYTYDGAGRLHTTTAKTGTKQSETTTYSYDAAGALRSVSAPGQPEITYTIDGFGRRVARAEGGTVTQGVIYRDPLRVAAITDASGGVTQRFVYTGTSPLPAYAVIDGVTYAEIPDVTGGPGLVIDTATGAVADRTVRTALGVTRSQTHPGFQALGFAAGLADPHTSLVRFGARDYNTATGRWTAPDPLLVGGGSANLYDYVGGDPVNRSDHSGLFCDYSSIGVTVSGGVGGAYGSSAFGVATAGGQVGVFGTGSAGVGLPGLGVGITFNCSDNIDPNNSPDLGDFAGPGRSAEVSWGGGTVGVDTGYGPDGKPSSHGWHAGFGPDTPGLDFTFGNTDIRCILGCDPGGSDGAGQVCGNLGCAPLGPPDHQADDPCAGGGCMPPDGPSSPNGGRGTGDPHLVTMDHTRYDMQGAGEFTALHSDSGDLVIQARLEPALGRRTVSIITAIAIEIEGDRLMIDEPDPAARMLHVTSPIALPGAGIATLPHGAILRQTPGILTLTLPDGGVILVRAQTSGLDFTVDLPDSRKGQVHGLLGPFTGDSAGTVQTADGATLTTDQLQDYKTLYRRYADSWRIAQQHSLFQYPAGRTTASYTDLAFPDPDPPAASRSARAAAEAICRQAGIGDDDMPACILDVTMTGDASFAGGLAATLQIVPGMPISNSQVAGQITPGQTVSGTLSAGARNSYTFSAPEGLVGYFAAAPGCATTNMLWDVEAADGTPLTGPSDTCRDIGRVRFPAAGDYRMVVYSSDSGSGPYSLTWTASRPDKQLPLSAGQTVSGTIDLPGAQDDYLIHVTAPTVGYFRAAAGCSTTDLWWFAYRRVDNRWTVIAEEGICSDMGRVEFDTPGDYQIVVQGGIPSSTATGGYTITWAGSRPDRITALSPGRTVSGTIDLPGARDIYTMDVAAGTVVYLQAAAGCTADGVYWRVEDPSTAALTGSERVCKDLGRMRFDRAGVYRLAIAGSEMATGSYRITWVESRPDRIRPLAGTGSGTIDKPGARDLWSIEGGATSVTLRAAAACTDGITWWVQQTSGGPVTATVPICTDIGTVALTPGGDYQLVIAGDGAATGSYSFTRGS